MSALTPVPSYTSAVFLEEEQTSFNTLLNEKISQVALTITSSDLLENLKHQVSSSAIVRDIGVLAHYRSAKDLTFANCSELGSVKTKADVLLQNCPKHGKVVAGNSIYIKESDASNLHADNVEIFFDKPKDSSVRTVHLSDGIAFKNLVVHGPSEIFLRNFDVGGAIIFKHVSSDYKGRVYLDKKSSIADLEETKANATVEIFATEEVEDEKESKHSKIETHDCDGDDPEECAELHKRSLLEESENSDTGSVSFEDEEEQEDASVECETKYSETSSSTKKLRPISEVFDTQAQQELFTMLNESYEYQLELTRKRKERQENARQEHAEVTTGKAEEVLESEHLQKKRAKSEKTEDDS